MRSRLQGKGHKKNVVTHTLRRLRERYGIHAGRKWYRKAVSWIRSGRASQLAHREGDSGVFEVWAGDERVPVVYDYKVRKIRTVLDRNRDIRGEVVG